MDSIIYFILIYIGDMLPHVFIYPTHKLMPKTSHAAQSRSQKGSPSNYKACRRMVQERDFSCKTFVDSMRLLGLSYFEEEILL